MRTNGLFSHAQFQGDLGSDALEEVGDFIVGVDAFVGCLVGEVLYEFLRHGGPEILGNEERLGRKR